MVLRRFAEGSLISWQVFEGFKRFSDGFWRVYNESISAYRRFTGGS